MIRDEEIKRLILYAKALGVRLTIRNFSFPEEAETVEWNGISININKHKHKNKTQLILSLLHELSHAKYINTQKGKISEAWELEEEREHGKKLPKKIRKEMVDFELNSLDSMMDIATELKIELSMNKIKKQCELDKWIYEHYLKEGEWPSEKIKKAKRKELKEKYK